MPLRVLDSNVLFRIWRGQYHGFRRVGTESDARASVKQWLATFPEDVIVTPVRLEFLAGTQSREDAQVADTFLAGFRLLDQGRVLPEDWRLAERFVRRVPFDGRPRGLVDCLIRAIADRLNAAVETHDEGFPPA